MKYFIVWVGGSEVGHFDTEEEATIVVFDWLDKGYDDVLLDEVEIEDKL